MTWKTRHTLISGIVLIVLANTVALSGVYYNRSGEPESTLLLSERELQIPYQSQRRKENSGIALRIKWKTVQPVSKDKPYYYYSSQQPGWLNENKLNELGFNLEHEKQKREKRGAYRQILPRNVLLVLENDGDAYQQDLRNARENLKAQRALVRNNPGKDEFFSRLKTAEQQYRRLQQNDSRLYVIDAGLDLDLLRKKYPDRSRYLVAGGSVRVWLQYDRKKQETRVSSYISGLDVTHINTAKVFHADLEKVMEDRHQRKDTNKKPNYVLRVSWGKRLEPWLQAIEAVRQSSSMDNP